MDVTAFLFNITSEKGLDLSNEITEKWKLFNLRQEENVKAIFSVHCQLMWFETQVLQRYSCITNLSQKTLLPFPTTYLVEWAFSAVTDLLSIKRSSLDVSEHGDLRAKLTSFKPRYAAVCSQNHTQGSHCLSQIPYFLS